MEKTELLEHNKAMISESNRSALCAALKQDDLNLSSCVKNYEKAVQDYTGAGFAVAFNSKMSAFSALFFAAGLSRYDRVVLSPLGTVESIACPASSGRSIRYGEIDPATGNLDTSKINLVINQPASRGREIIILSSFAGNPVEIEPISRLIQCPSTVLVEELGIIPKLHSDCDFSIFDFVVLTHSEKLARKLQLYRDCGAVSIKKVGAFSCHELQALQGLLKLQKLDARVSRLQYLFRLYRETLARNKNIELFPESVNMDTCFALKLKEGLKGSDPFEKVIPLSGYGTFSPGGLLNLKEFIGCVRLLPMNECIEDSELLQICEACSLSFKQESIPAQSQLKKYLSQIPQS